MSLTWLQLGLASVSGALVALLLSVFGGGGSVLAVPLLLYLVGVRDPLPLTSINLFNPGCAVCTNRRNPSRTKIRLSFSSGTRSATVASATRSSTVLRSNCSRPPCDFKYAWHSLNTKPAVHRW